jgi:hypothetical protein
LRCGWAEVRGHDLEPDYFAGFGLMGTGDAKDGEVGGRGLSSGGMGGCDSEDGSEQQPKHGEERDESMDRSHENTPKLFAHQGTHDRSIS